MINSNFLKVVAAALTFFAVSAQAALVTPAGLNNGDKYHVIFVSSTTRNALSSDIADYDAHVQAAADAAGIGSSLSLSWSALGSTPSVSAYDHLAPLFSNINNVPIYNQNGELLATSFVDLWDGELLSPYSVLYDENGAENIALVWTGTANSGGAAYTNFTLGSANQFSIFANSNSTYTWETNASGAANQLFSIYGISQELTVDIVPIPAAAWLFGSALLGLAWIRRKVSYSANGVDPYVVPSFTKAR